ncbi:DUF6884 domain-containing protein [Streptomyces sp. NPDC001822]|uniref:DUF6884 domain-containing protein n=1 Tax=Streptomyces sp. NPDC001822 TaxID=3364614 RepID=UPI0036AE6901
MSDLKTLPVPGQLRRHVLKNLRPTTKGERDLLDASQVGADELVAQGMNSLNSIDLHLTNDAIGAAIDIARGWLDSDNGNNVMAGKSMLKYELEFEPDDPREIRHQIKMPKSLAGQFVDTYGFNVDAWQFKDLSEAVKVDLSGMSWTGTGASGRVRAETLGWFLAKARHLCSHPNSAVQRSASKFFHTFTEPFEQTQRLINGYLSTDTVEDQAPEPAGDEPDFTEAIHGRQDEAAAPPKRLVVVACGGKKADAPGRIPADERYTGNYFRACMMAAEVMDGPTLILSAKYGFVSPSDEIENYDVKWGGKGSIRLAAVRQQVKGMGLEDAKVTVLGGERYVKAARQIWPDAEAPLEGGIGQQLKQLAGIYDGEALGDDEAGEGPSTWTSGQFREVSYLPSRTRPDGPVIWYGGKAGKANPKPGRWVKVKIVYTGDSRYDLVDQETRESAQTVTLVSKVHWALVENAPAPVEVEAEVEEIQAPEPGPATKPATKAGNYEVSENWLELAEEGNTEAARRYWTRRCEEWRLTGK